MVSAQPMLRIPRPDLLPLHLRELLWEDRSESPVDEPVGERLDLRTHRQLLEPPRHVRHDRTTCDAHRLPILSR